MNSPPDIAIVGAGPIGIELAVGLSKAGMTYRHFEAGQIGSTISWYAPDTMFFSSGERLAIAGVPLYTKAQEKPTREDYLCYLRSVTKQFSLNIESHTLVSRIEKEKNGLYTLEIRPSSEGVGSPNSRSRYSKTNNKTDNVTDTTSAEKISAKRIALCIGDMHQPNRLNIPGEDLPHVSHYLEEPHQYFRKRVLIVGGKNSAVEAAIRLQRLGARVTMSYRATKLDHKRIKYWLYPELMHYIKTKAIEYIPESTLLEIDSEKVRLQTKGAAKDILFDYVLLLTGYIQDKSLFRSLGINMHGPGLVPEYNALTMETNLPGVYVAGTAVAGTQLGGVTEFIETSHIHVQCIIAAILGESTPEQQLLDPGYVES